MDLSNKLAIDEINLANKRVLIRVDFNVPMQYGKITDSKRIKESLETICYALDHDARSVILISHLGKPDGERKMQYSLNSIASELRKLLRRPVIFLHDCVGEAIELVCMDPVPGSVILLENLAFHIEEIGVNSKNEVAEPENVKDFRERLRKLGDVYVNDAFAIAQKPYSSILAEGFDLKVAGLLMKRELACFSMPLGTPPRPYLAILGGAQVRDKLMLIDKLLDKVDEMILGGGMAFTFLALCRGMEIGESLFDGETAEYVDYLWEKAQGDGVPIHLPVDFIVSDDFSPEAETSYADDNDGIPRGYMGLDIGPYTIQTFSEIIYRSNLIVWNGPMGVYEWENFEEGTKLLMEAVALQTERGATSIIGGEDTADACAQFDVTKRMTLVSTGGGASLELLEENELPGVEMLTSKVQPCPCKNTIERDGSKKDKKKYEPVEMMRPKRDVRRISRIKNLLEKEKREQQKLREPSVPVSYPAAEEYGEYGAEGFADQMENFMRDEFGNLITDENGNPIPNQYGNQTTDQNGNQTTDQNENQSGTQDGSQNPNQYGNQMTDEYGNPLTDEYGNPITQEYAPPPTDEYGNPITEGYGNPHVGQVNQLAGRMGVHFAKQMEMTHPMAPTMIHSMGSGKNNNIRSTIVYPMIGGIRNQMGGSMQYLKPDQTRGKLGYSMDISKSNPVGIAYAKVEETNPTGYGIAYAMTGQNKWEVKLNDQ